MNIIEEMKERVGVRELLESYGIYPKRGTNIYCCFAHDDRNPSSGIMKGDRKFHCYACGFTGDIFDIVQHFDKCDLKTATKIIDDRFRLGLLHELSHKEKLELARQRKERERAKAEKLWWERYERSVLNEIIDNLRVLETCEYEFRIKKGQYRGEWSNTYGDVYFYVIKQMRWLNWLYDAICGTDHPECEFDYTYPTDKMELLQMVKRGQITI